MLDPFLAVLHDHKDEMLVLTSLVSACVSLTATIFGPRTQMRIARLNANTNILVSSRIKWIESLQTNIANLAATIERAEFLAKSMKIIQDKHPKMSEKQSEEFARMLKEQEERTFERNKASALLGLSLDVSTEKRNELFRAITDYAMAVPGVSTESSEHLAALARVQIITREILQNEWAWVKQEITGKSTT